MLAIIAIMSFFVSMSHAQVANFTQQEINDHHKNIATIAAVSAQCLDDVFSDHMTFYKKWGVSKYYGDRREDYSSQGGLVAALKSYGKPAELVSQLQPISCIGLAMKCLKKGFSAANMDSTWNKIYAELKKDNNFFGTDLQKNLIKLGWKSLYWNPQPAMNLKWDKEDQTINPLKPGKVWNPVWGGHAEGYAQALKGYYFERDLYVDDATSLVGFNETQPPFFKHVPFFIGTAHAGYHVFPGRNGDVIEAHSKRNLDSIDNLQFSEFNPLKNGGGPKWTPSERYRSGVIVVPDL